MEGMIIDVEVHLMCSREHVHFYSLLCHSQCHQMKNAFAQNDGYFQTKLLIITCTFSWD